MRLRFEAFDGRSYFDVAITDLDTGSEVGRITNGGQRMTVPRRLSQGGITVSLFEGRYRARVHSRNEAKGFVSGVEAVLNHIAEETT